MLLRAVAVVAILAAGLTASGAQALVPSDPLAMTWTYGALNLPAAWDVTTGSEEVVIAVVDSGVEALHADLVGAVDPGYDFVDDDGDASDLNGHGTAVAGIAAARANNGLGAAGACWSCRILPIRVLRPDGFALNATMARAVDFAVERGAAVVNLSVYGENRNSALRESIRRARAAGVLVVAAAGNEAVSTPEYPAAYPETISVGATIEDGALADYSSRGDWVKVAAPGCTPTTLLGGGFGAGCGTSGATPLVAGIVALLRASAPFATAAQIETALARTARPVRGVRFGLVDARGALEHLGRPAPDLEPTIDGIASAGQRLTAYSGIWAGAGLAEEYRWERCRAGACEPAGTGRAYVVRRSDGGARLRTIVSAPGVTAEASLMSDLVPESPRSASAPSISGRLEVGAKLTGHRGSWTGTAPRFEYAWIRCDGARCPRGRPVGFARTYRLREADRSHRLVFVVIAVNDAGRARASSAPTGRIR
jgi:hypothetical protein